MKHIAAHVLVMAVLVPVASAQNTPDFSGVWVIDPARSDLRNVYGQMRLVRQTTDAVHVTVVHGTGFGSSPTVSFIPWQYRIGRWGPRRGGEQSREPLARAQWDGGTLVTAKAPGTHYSVLQAWRLAADGKEMIVQGVSKEVSFSFDFKVGNLPRRYFGDGHVYVREPEVPTCADCTFSLRRDGVRWGASLTESPFVFHLLDDASAVRMTCKAAECVVTEIVRGRRTSPRVVSEGQTTTIPLSSDIVTEVKGQPFK